MCLENCPEFVRLLSAMPNGGVCSAIPDPQTLLICAFGARSFMARSASLRKGMLYSRAMIRRLSILALLILGTPAFGGQRPAESDPFARLRFLAGEWRGDQSGQPGHGTCERKYEFVLAGKFLQVRNKSNYPPQEANKNGEIHEDLGMIGFDRARKKLVFRQFHVEGFVNTYVEEAGGDAKTIVFSSEAIENIAPGWRARETFTIVSDDEFIERFELAAPAKNFELYAEAHLRRVR